jgi:hypothetical protein
MCASVESGLSIRTGRRGTFKVYDFGKYSGVCWECIFENLSRGGPHDEDLAKAIRDAYGVYVRREGPIPILFDGWEVRVDLVAETCRNQGRCSTST